jgi:AraC family transcriptional activator of pobA
VDRPPHTFFDPRNGDPSLRVTDLDLAPGPGEPDRTNCFTVASVAVGGGTFWADDGAHPFAGPCLLFATPYQHTRLAVDRPTRGTVVRFHANFLCLETYHHEVGCNGVLFNDPYGVPTVALDAAAAAEVSDLIGKVRRELAEEGLAQAEVLVSYMKVLLVLATRLKLRGGAAAGSGPTRRPPLLDAFRDLVEAHYRTRHAPADYADLLGVTAKALGRVVREHLGRTPTDLIRDRVLKHARWELLHTLRPVKEVARELGFDDELYFSRVFRKATGLSPTAFREFETAIRGGSNLSMPSGGPSIPPPAPAGQNAPVPASDAPKSGP